MIGGQRSSWLAGRLGLVGLGVFLIAAVVQFRPSSSDIEWRTYAAGLEESAATGKPVYVDLYATWCVPCKQMDRVTFQNDSVRQLLHSTYIPVRIDIDTRQFDDTLKASWRLSGVPTSLIVAANGSVLGRRVGYHGPRDFITWLSDSALLAYAGWLDLPLARRRSAELKKPLLVILTGELNNLEEVQLFFLHPEFRAFLQDRFVVTRIAGAGPVEVAQYAELQRLYSVAPTPRDGMVLLALTHDGILLGQVVVKEEDLGDQERIMGFLRRYLEPSKRVSEKASTSALSF